MPMNHTHTHTGKRESGDMTKINSKMAVRAEGQSDFWTEPLKLRLDEE